MIPSSAIKAFLKQPRDDHRWMKQLTHKELDAALKLFKPPIKVSSEFRLHQKVGVLLGIAYPQFCYWYDMGTGKSAIALTLLRYWWDCGRLNRALIFVKSDKAFPTWEAQIKRWNIDIPYVTLGSGSSVNKWRELESFKEGLIILTYPGATAMTSRRVKSKKKPKNKMKLEHKKVALLGKDVGAIVMDESTNVGNHDSLQSKLCIKLGKIAKVRYALAGRPFGRDPTLMWNQYNIIDGGETFGETLGLFRAAFFIESDNIWDPKGYAKDYVFKKRMMSQLMDVAQHRSISYDEHECIDVPKWQSIVEEVRLPEEAGAYYKKVVEQIISAKGNISLMQNAFLRMRQLSSGFLGFRNDESGAKVEIAFQENPKLECLLDKLDSLPDGRKAVVFYVFTHSGRRIFESLKEIDRKGIWLWSGTKDYKADLKRFQTDPKCTVAVINDRIGAYSLDGLQDVANYLFFFESPCSVIDRSQAEKRVRRQGQKRRVFQYDLVVKDTLDQRILDFHSDGDALLQALRKNPSLLLSGHKV